MSGEKNSPKVGVTGMETALDEMMAVLDAMTGRLLQNGYTPEQARGIVTHFVTRDDDSKQGGQTGGDVIPIRATVEIAMAILEHHSASGQRGLR